MRKTVNETFRNIAVVPMNFLHYFVSHFLISKKIQEVYFQQTAILFFSLLKFHHPL